MFVGHNDASPSSPSSFGKPSILTRSGTATRSGSASKGGTEEVLMSPMNRSLASPSLLQAASANVIAQTRWSRTGIMVPQSMAGGKGTGLAIAMNGSAGREHQWNRRRTDASQDS